MIDVPEEQQEEREFDIDLDAEDGQPLEVDVDVEDPDEPQPEVAQEPEPEPAQEEPRRRSRLDERLAALAKRAAEAEARAVDAERRAAERDQQLATERTVQVGAMENALKAELTSVKRELVDAKTIGDYSAEAEATAKLAKLSADLSAVEAFRASQPRQQEQTQQQERQAPQQRQAPSNPVKDAWVTTNSWFDRNSPDYDQEMAIDATAFAQKLEARLQRDGKANEIGTPQYFTLIDEHINKLYPEDDAPPARKMPAMRTDKSVAPVSRQTGPASAPKKNIVRLSAEQRQIAEAVSPNLPPQQAWAAYARNI